MFFETDASAAIIIHGSLSHAWWGTIFSPFMLLLSMLSI